MGVRMRTVVRGLLRQPGFTLATIATLALAIAANTVIFSVVDGILLDPLPYPEADRLVRIHHQAPGLNVVDDLGLSDATYFHYLDAEPITGLALYAEGAVNLATREAPERAPSARVSHPLFRVLRTRPARGRPFVAEDETPGADPVVILSDDLWRNRFGTDPGILDAEVRIDGRPHRVVGVMPPGFAFPAPETRLWLPMTLDPEQTNIGALGQNGVARLAPGWSIVAAERRLAERIEPLEELFPIEQGSGVLARAGFTTRVIGLKDHLVGGLDRSLWLLLASVGFLLLIACGNVANLFLARAEGREGETAVRTALGARRRHVVAEFLFESVTLGVLAGVVAVPLSLAGVSALVGFGPQSLPRLSDVAVDGSALGVTVLLSLLAGLLLGAFPALRADHRWLSGALGDSGRDGTPGHLRLRLRNLLVAGQVALTLVLLVGSALMFRSFRNLTAVDPGFVARDVLTFQIALTETEYPEEMDSAAFVQRFLEVVEKLPGVQSAGAVSDLPLSGQGSGSGVLLEDHPEGPDDLPKVHFDKLTAPGYFETMRIPLVAGRSLRPDDHRELRPVVVVNEAFARRYWPDGEAVGKRIQPRDGAPDPERWLTIVGVVGTVTSQRLDEPPVPLIYYPLASPSRSIPARRMSFVVRTDGPPTALVATVRERLRALDPDLPMAGVQPMSALVDRALVLVEFTMVMLAIGAAGALLIGAVGIYGVISYLVARRRREIGIRMALGARAGEIATMVVRRSLAVTLTGIGTGLVAAVSLSGALGTLLHGVEPRDPVSFLGVILLLLAVATLAAWLPARRAARLHPLAAIKEP